MIVEFSELGYEAVDKEKKKLIRIGDFVLSDEDEKSIVSIATFSFIIKNNHTIVKS